MMTETSRGISFNVLRVRQPIGEFYIGSMSSKDLIDISDFDIRHINNEDGIDSYLGIQRQINTKRVSEITAYARTGDATFPTAVILAVREESTTLVPRADCGDNFFSMTLTNVIDDGNGEDVTLFRQIARVIDGQHRIAALRDARDFDFEVNVSIFVGADIADQANVFSTVNLHQTKVSKSLVYDLFELSKSRSPERTCHDAVVALDKIETSPFYRKIKRLGVSTEGRYGETLSQATVVEGILQYISANRLQLIGDREIGRRGARWPRVGQTEASRLIFRPWFVDGKDAEIADQVWEYFDAVRERWPKAWSASGQGLMLNRTNGFKALMRFLRPAFLYLSAPGQLVRSAQFLEIFRAVNLQDEEFNPTRYNPGTSGETRLYRDLVEQSKVSAAGLA